MKRKAFIISVVAAVCLCTVSALALTESEVQQQVDSVGREAVTGNIFIWFLCAIAFLKISQKIDSFMSSLGIHVGHTGGSMLAEALIAMRGVGVAKSIAGGRTGGKCRSWRRKDGQSHCRSCKRYGSRGSIRRGGRFCFGEP